MASFSRWVDGREQPAISALCITYIEVVRGVPLISILFMGNIMLQLFMPQSLPPIDRVVRVMVAITFFTAAYMAEIVRGGLQAIPKGQYDAAYALGYSGFKSMRIIILPQALRIVDPGYRQPVHRIVARYDFSRPGWDSSTS